MTGSHMLLKFPNALEKAYQLREKGDYCSIIVDYNPGYLHLLICETEHQGGYALVENQVQMPHLGESSILSSQKDSHYEQIEAALTKFLALTAVRKGAQCRMPYSNIKVGTVSGEASAEGRKRIKELLQTVVAELGKNTVLDSIDGGYVGAFGAGYAAKSQAEIPKSMDDYIDLPRRVSDGPMAN